MATGSDKDEGLRRPLDVQGDGQSAGVQAVGEVEGNAVTPLGNPGVRHWQASYIGRTGLGDRANVFFAAVEMTRMPMMVTDPNQPDNPIVFANNAFFDLTGYEEHEVACRNCRFLQGPDTDRATIAEVRAALCEQRAVSVDVINYMADGEAFWNALFIGPIFDHDGKLLSFFASQMDITERRSMLESHLQAQKMEAIGQLSAGMADVAARFAMGSAACAVRAPVASRCRLIAALTSRSWAVPQTQVQARWPSVSVPFLWPHALHGLLDGYQRPSGMPVLVTTGYMDELPARGAREQALDVLAKPYQHQDLLDRMHAPLHARRAA